MRTSMPGQAVNYLELLKTAQNLPSLPEIVNESLRLIQQKGSELSEFEDCLKHDPPLVAKMLRVVNSPIYALSCRVSSIKEAIMVLGFNSLGSLILAASCAEHLERNCADYGHCKSGLWLHSIATAAAARKLAAINCENRDTQELVFIAGLLHDIGKLLLAPFLRIRGKTLHDHGPDWTEQEREVLGLDHHEAGALLLEKWNLDSTLVSIVADSPKSPCPEQQRNLQAILRLADKIACEAHIGYRTATKIECKPLLEERSLLGLEEPEDWEVTKTGVGEAMDLALQSLRNLSA